MRDPRYRLNLWFLAILAAVCLVLGGGLYALHKLQVRRNAGMLLAAATKAEASGSPEKAVRLLRQYLVIRPADGDTLGRYGLLLAGLARTRDDRAAAFAVLNRAIRQGSARPELRRKAAELGVALGRYAEAEVHVRTLRKEPPSDAVLEGLLGRCLAGTRSYDKAETALEMSVKLDPKQIDSAVMLAVLRRDKLNKPFPADLGMDRMVAANHDDPKAHLDRARYRMRYKLDGADADLAQALKLAPEGPDVLLVAGERAAERGALDDARTRLEAAAARRPGDERAYAALARLELNARRPEAAVAALRKGVEAAQDSRLLPIMLAEALIPLGKLDEVQSMLEKARQATPGDASIDLIEAELLLARHDWMAAIAHLERCRARFGEQRSAGRLAAQCELLLGRAYEQLGAVDLRLDACRRAVAADADLLTARAALVAALAAAGRTDEALTECRGALSRHPELGTALARLLIVQNARLPRAEQHWDEAEKALGAAERATPGADEVAVLRSALRMRQDRPDAAREALETALAKRPRSVELWATLTALDGALQNPDAAAATAARARRELGGDRVELRLALAGVWAGRGGEPARRALEGLAEPSDDFTAQERDRLDGGLAAAHVLIGDRDDARRLWETLARRHPADLAVRLRLLDVAIEAGDQDRIQRIRDEVRRLEGDAGTYWRYADAARLVLRSGPEALAEARELLKEVAKLRPGWERITALSARLAERAGDRDQAIELYRRAVERGERRPDVVRRCVALLEQAGRTADADAVLRLITDQAAPAPPLLRLAAEFSLKSHPTDEALTLARRAAAAGHERPADLLWLAQLCDAAGRPEEAEKALRRAVDQGGAPEAWLALVRHLMRAGRRADAEAAIAQARAKLPADRQWFVLALGDLAIGQVDRALGAARSAVDAKPDDPAVRRAAVELALAGSRARYAEPQLRWLIAAGDRAPRTLRLWARRTLARTRAAAGGSAGVEEALGLIDENLKEDGRAPEDRAARATILAGRPERWPEAIKELEALATEKGAPPQPQFLLARIEEADGDWPRARARLTALLGSQPKDAGAIAYLAEGLLRRGDAVAAAPWVAKLKALEPASLRTVALEARAKAAAGRGDEASALLKGYADKHAQQAPRIAVLLEACGRDADGEKLLRTYASGPGDPRRLLALAALLGRQGRTAEALDVCEAVAKDVPAPVVASAALAILVKSTAAREQVARVERLVEAERSAAADAPDATVHLAIVRELQGRSSDAETIYRGLIAKQPRSVAALNNCALLVAEDGRRGDEALALIDRALEAAGPLPDLLDSRAIILLGMGRTPAAIADAKLACLTSADPAMRLHLAHAYSLSKERDAALAWLKEAQGLGLRPDALMPRDRPVYRSLLALGEGR